MITSVLPVDLTWSEIYDLAAFYREKMQRYAEHANNLKYCLELRPDMLRYADAAADMLHKWEAVMETYHLNSIRRDIAA